MTNPVKTILSGASLCVLGSILLDYGGAQATSATLLIIGLFGITAGTLSLPIE